MEAAQYVRVRLDIEDAGWSTFFLTLDDRQFEVRDVSYTTDALGDLVLTAYLMIKGERDARLSFDSEPRETRLVFKRVSDHASPSHIYEFRALRFDDIYGHQADTEGLTLFEAVIRADFFGLAVLAEADRVVNDFGLENYEPVWRSNFPLAQLESLRRGLGLR